MTPRLHVPVLEPEDVVRHLGKQEKHWREGRSAHALAYSWHGQRGFPASIASLLKSHPVFQSADLIDAFFERQTDLESRGTPSQTDLLAVVGVDGGLATIAVEGKAGEPAGELVKQWLKKGGMREARIKRLCETLELNDRGVVETLRYQLLHRSAAAVYEAKRYRAKLAAMIVQSFCDDSDGLADFYAFARALGQDNPQSGTLMGPFCCEGVSLYVGWIQDQPKMSDTAWSHLDSLRKYAQAQESWFGRVRAYCDDESSKLKPTAE